MYSLIRVYALLLHPYGDSPISPDLAYRGFGMIRHGARPVTMQDFFCVSRQYHVGNYHPRSYRFNTSGVFLESGPSRCGEDLRVTFAHASSVRVVNTASNQKPQLHSDM